MNRYVAIRRLVVGIPKRLMMGWYLWLRTEEKLTWIETNFINKPLVLSHNIVKQNFNAFGIVDFSAHT